MAKKITALPSMVMMNDGSIKPLDSFTPEERKEWQKRFWKKVERVFNYYVNTNDEFAMIIKNEADLLEQADL